MNHDEIFLRAVQCGCEPVWDESGLVGAAWYCECERENHGDCTRGAIVTLESLGLTLPAQRESSV
jgi:hypothetical protein